MTRRGNRPSPEDPLAPYGLGGPTTCATLAKHARERPDAPAAAMGTRVVSYQALTADTLRLLHLLRQSGLCPPQVLGVAVGDRYRHMTVLLAAEALGLTTVSLGADELLPPASLGRLCDRVAVDAILPGPDPARQLIIPMSPPDHASGAGLEALQRPAEPDAVVRLIKSSGTTGLPKVMRVTHRIQEQTLANNLLYAASVLPRPHFLCLYGFGVRGAHSRVLLTLRAGGTVHFIADEAIGPVLAAGLGNYVLFVTGDLERFMRSAPVPVQRPDLVLDVIGAALSPRLRTEVQARLTDRVVATYGTNETHHISLVGDDNVGRLFPGVQVRVTDDAGNAVAPGETGLIWLRTPAMTDGYVDAPELTRGAFVDGWYRTDDAGYQPSPETLVVLGRQDGMLNIGGVKISPEPVVAELKSVPGVEDAFVMSLGDSVESGALLVALQLAEGVAATQVRAPVDAIVRRLVRFYHLLPTRALPRTGTGKVIPDAVRALYRETASRL
ncbi:MAG: class I adenylate-forming enzyme family protein [Acetobacteraceae bacterium]